MSFENLLKIADKFQISQPAITGSERKSATDTELKPASVKVKQLFFCQVRSLICFLKEYSEYASVI